MILRDSPLRGTFGFADVLALAEPNIGDDPGGYRREFVNLVRNAQALGGNPVPNL
jgi:Ca-activated chloride channel family protein